MNTNTTTEELPAAILKELFERYRKELLDPTADHLKPEFDPTDGGKPRRHTAMAKGLEAFPVRPIPVTAGRTWIWSDLHLGHARVIEYSNRPYPDAEAMNEALLSTWEATIGPDDLTLVLGDVCMAEALTEDIFARIAGVPGHKVLVAGNHDFTNSGQLRVKGFDEVCAMLYRTGTPGRPPLLLTHAPVPDLPGEWINVHGHWHDMNTHSPRHINVSVEQLGFRPAPFEHVAELAGALAPGRELRGTTLQRALRIKPFAGAEPAPEGMPA